MTIKGQKLVLPSWKFALAQMAISSANWMAMGAIIWLLMGQDVNYFCAGRTAGEQYRGRHRAYSGRHRRAGGRILALLAGEHTSQGTIIAALLAYRVLYYFIPLLLALVCYLIPRAGRRSCGRKTSGRWRNEFKQTRFRFPAQRVLSGKINIC